AHKGVDSVRVVRRIHKDQRRGAHRLKPAGRGDPTEPGLHGGGVESARLPTVGEERLDGRERERRIVCLVLSIEGNEDVDVSGGGGAQGQQLAADAGLPVNYLEAFALPVNGGVVLRGGRGDGADRAFGLAGHHDGRAILDDARL